MLLRWNYGRWRESCLAGPDNELAAGAAREKVS